LEFAYLEAPTQATLFPLQTADEIEYEETEEVVVAATPGARCPDRYLVNMGEKLMSLRQLLRRDNFCDVVAEQAADTTDALLVWSCLHGRYPHYFGFDPNGVNSAKGIVVPASNFPFNFSKITLFNWIAPMYIGMRGSVNWTYACDMGSLADLADIRAARIGTNSSRTTALFNNRITATTLTSSGWARSYFANEQAGLSGVSVTNQNTQSSVSVNYPFYDNYLFHFTNPTYNSLGTALDGSSADNMLLTVIVKPTSDTSTTVSALTLNRYWSIGPDFTFYFFLCCPTFIPSVTPTAN